jgi:hypothetical protein
MKMQAVDAAVRILEAEDITCAFGVPGPRDQSAAARNPEGATIGRCALATDVRRNHTHGRRAAGRATEARSAQDASFWPMLPTTMMRWWPPISVPSFVVLAMISSVREVLIDI